MLGLQEIVCLNKSVSDLSEHPIAAVSVRICHHVNINQCQNVIIISSVIRVWLELDYREGTGTATVILVPYNQNQIGG